MNEIPKIELKLTVEQRRKMRDLLKQCEDADKAGSPGALMAQVLKDRIIVAFVDSDMCYRIQQITGINKGTLIR